MALRRSAAQGEPLPRGLRRLACERTDAVCWMRAASVPFNGSSDAKINVALRESRTASDDHEGRDPVPGPCRTAHLLGAGRLGHRLRVPGGTHPLGSTRGRASWICLRKSRSTAAARLRPTDEYDGQTHKRDEFTRRRRRADQDHVSTSGRASPPERSS